MEPAVCAHERSARVVHPLVSVTNPIAAAMTMPGVCFLSDRCVMWNVILDADFSDAMIDYR